MSRSERLSDAYPPAVCYYCGLPIPRDGREDCPARRDGRCRP
ncbi:hypothetical protein ACOZ4L_05780 [Haloplanus ruber]|uniref:Rubrerythrin-like domain-containing protein n=1 Tax=Haloplanus ruber TaxID=869892 RepID=A0ABD6CT34_9EURY|nr:hypothetical protein [Haloplanus ruber]